ncbi:MAG: hypothetical protein OSA92_05565, partial [Pirellulaceae bacterium]|nr:hypothetical protein [Pirellulaceae bacterium]
ANFSHGILFVSGKLGRIRSNIPLSRFGKYSSILKLEKPHLSTRITGLTPLLKAIRTAYQP